MFKIRLKVGCIVLFVCAVEKIVLYNSKMCYFGTTKAEMIKFATVIANCVQNNLWKFCKRILKYTENNNICLIGAFFCRTLYSLGITVCSKIRLMRIFAEVHWPGGFKWEWGCQKWRFSLILPRISFEPPHLRPHLLYYAIYSHSGSSATSK